MCEGENKLGLSWGVEIDLGNSSIGRRVLITVNHLNLDNKLAELTLFSNHLFTKIHNGSYKLVLIGCPLSFTTSPQLMLDLLVGWGLAGSN